MVDQVNEVTRVVMGTGMGTRIHSVDTESGEQGVGQEVKGEEGVVKESSIINDHDDDNDNDDNDDNNNNDQEETSTQGINQHSFNHQPLYTTTSPSILTPSYTTTPSPPPLPTNTSNTSNQPNMHPPSSKRNRLSSIITRSMPSLKPSRPTQTRKHSEGVISGGGGGGGGGGGSSSGNQRVIPLSTPTTTHQIQQSQDHRLLHPQQHQPKPALSPMWESNDDSCRSPESEYLDSLWSSSGAAVGGGGGTVESVGKDERLGDGVGMRMELRSPGLVHVQQVPKAKTKTTTTTTTTSEYSQSRTTAIGSPREVSIISPNVQKKKGSNSIKGFFKRAFSSNKVDKIEKEVTTTSRGGSVGRGGGGGGGGGGSSVRESVRSDVGLTTGPPIPVRVDTASTITTIATTATATATATTTIPNSPTPTNTPPPPNSQRPTRPTINIPPSLSSKSSPIQPSCIPLPPSPLLSTFYDDNDDDDDDALSTIDRHNSHHRSTSHDRSISSKDSRDTHVEDQDESTLESSLTTSSDVLLTPVQSVDEKEKEMMEEIVSSGCEDEDEDDENETGTLLVFGKKSRSKKTKNLIHGNQGIQSAVEPSNQSSFSTTGGIPVEHLMKKSTSGDSKYTHSTVNSTSSTPTQNTSHEVKVDNEIQMNKSPSKRISILRIGRNISPKKASSPTNGPSVQSPSNISPNGPGLGQSTSQASFRRAPPPAASARYRVSMSSTSHGVARSNSNVRRSALGSVDYSQSKPRTALERRQSVAPTMHTNSSIQNEASQIMDQEEKDLAESFYTF